MNNTRMRVCIFAVMAFSLLPGCGGGAGAPQQDHGTLAFTILWPERSRLIPLAAESIKVVVTLQGTVVAQQVVARPPAPKTSSTVTFDNLPTGDVIITATAHPNPDGTGVVQARGAVPITIEANKVTPVSITMETAITQVKVAPVDPSVQKGSTVEVVATALDAGNNVVLSAAGNWSWQASTGAVTLTPNGDRVTVLGSSVGTATVTATESESGRSGQTQVTVTTPGGVSVEVSPATATMTVQKTKLFSANVTGTTDQTVTWSVQEGAAGGSVTSTGVYRSPAVLGTYHVVATSQADPTRSAIATVIVEAGSVNVIID
jgi:hypothetical protein